MAPPGYYSPANNNSLYPCQYPDSLSPPVYRYTSGGSTEYGCGVGLALQTVVWPNDCKDFCPGGSSFTAQAWINASDVATSGGMTCFKAGYSIEHFQTRVVCWE